MRRLAMTGLAVTLLASGLHAENAQPSFLVFFDWGKAEVSRDSAAILDEAAAAFQRQGGARLLLSGHSDRSGPPWANRVAARKRAEAVRDYLAGRGVPGSAMTIAVFGEAQPIVPTEDDVREAQNRRVEVRLVAAP